MFQASSEIVVIQGPLWSAQAQLLDLAAPQQNKALRSLFLEQLPTSANPPAYRLGTVIALCYVRQVAVQSKQGAELSGSYVWHRNGEPPAEPFTLERVRELLKTGQLSLLLLLPDDLSPEKSADQPTRFTCLTGEIYLDRLQPAANARLNLFRALLLDPIEDINQVPSHLETRNRHARHGGEKLISELSVHSSGLSIYGRVTLPWIGANQATEPHRSEETTISAPFQLAQQFTTTEEQILWGDLQLTLERERLTATEEQQWIKCWQALIQHLNPRHPVYGRKVDNDIQTTYPNWVTLEFPNPNRVPRLRWQINQRDNTSLLNLQADEVYIVLSDRALYDPEPPTSLARMIPSTVTLRLATRDRQTPQIILEVTAESAVEPRTLPKITYRFDAADSEQGGAETLSATNLKTAFSPVETPQLIRQTQNLPTPEWSSGDLARPVEPAVVWGFMPLENGWAQLPIPNLTEQIYLDSASNQEPEANPNSPVALVQGALSLGNDRRSVLSRYAQEQPWSLTITDAAALQGTWTLTIEGSSLKLTAVSLVLHDPSVILNGFFWLSTGQPRLQDALPDLDNWVSGLRSIPLETVAPAKTLFPSAILLEWQEIILQVREDGAELPSAMLKPWQFSYTVDSDNLKKLTDKQVLPAPIFSKELPDTLPLIWQCHPHLPMIQALPLTQNQLPANYPSASRQLVPYELDAISAASPRPQEWRFAVTHEQGAEVWPKCVGKTIPAIAWQNTFDLPLVSLSVPGLVLEPTTDATENRGAVPNLLLQYRFDLPYTDEVNALAQLPKEPVPPDQVSPLPDSIPPASLLPLKRETFAQHWQQLSTLASLSMADAVEALEMPLSSGSDQEPALIQNLIEPLVWPVQIEFNLRTYPGAIALQNGLTITLTGETALKGISGEFYVNDDNHLTGEIQSGQTAYHLTAGSLAAHLEAGQLRDQRGLFRAATLFGDQFLQTRVRFQRQPNQIETYHLTTTRQPQKLQVGATEWRIWFRDLPLQVMSAEVQRFHRSIQSNILSSVVKDINDPHARSREHDFLTGYEWRLATLAQEMPHLPLLGLHFYPLTLDEVEASAESIQTVVMTGRLQLPLSEASEAQELEDFSNAVQVTFRRTGDTLKLDSIALVAGGLGEWPLALEQNELTDAPLLTWEAVRLNDLKNQLIVEGLQLRFFLFEQEWAVADWVERQGSQVTYKPLIQWMSADHTLTFSARNSASTGRNILKGVYAFAPDGNALSPKRLTIELDLTQGQHSVDLAFEIRLGKQQATGRSAFSATVNFPILQAGISLGSIAQWISGYLVDDLVLKYDGENPRGLESNILHVNGQSLQFQWTAYELQRSLDATDATSEPFSEALQLLPGLELQPGFTTAPGFAALTFAAIRQPDSGIPQLQLETAFVEAMLFCRWGESLQQDLAAPSLARVFGSSAGDLVCGYTIQWQSQAWRETLLLNGVLEIKNLISWPQELVLRTEANQILALLPARQTKDAQPQPLAHLRHTLRILFNQHLIPDDLLEMGDDNLLFQLQADAIWQFQAVVEHQLVNVSGLSDAALTLQLDRRWTTVQEVRWLSPKRFQTVLRDWQKATTLDPAGNPTALGSAAGGYLNQHLSVLLTEGDQGTSALLDRLQKTLLVESSAHHWIHQPAIRDKSATTLQFLPNGSQLGILSSPDDYLPSDPSDPEWLLLTLPFLGRLQTQANDRLDLLKPVSQGDEHSNPPPVTRSVPFAHPLQVDPIIYLAARLPNPNWALIFASWGDESAVTLAVSVLDSALGSTWPRLDAASLEESWFRLHHPIAEPDPTSLQSVLAALPDTPSRLSRSLALKALTQGKRTSYPPARSTQHTTDPNDKNDSFASDASKPNRLVWQPDHLLVTPSLRQIHEGLEVLYTFQKDPKAENIVRDVSGVGESLNLGIRHLNHVEWLPGGGLKIRQPTLICSIRAADKIIKACQKTHEITLAVWLKPARKTLQDGNPARIVTFSENTLHRNFTLAQGEAGPYHHRENNAYIIRLRTNRTDSNATAHHPADTNKPGPVVYGVSPLVQPDQLVHVVFTRTNRSPNNESIAKIYINGQLADIALVNGMPAKAVPMPGDFSSWNPMYYLALANEVSFHERNTEHRSWLGEYHQVAIYSRALTDAEISQHYQLGHKAVLQSSVSYAWAVPGLQWVSSALPGFSPPKDAQLLQADQLQAANPNPESTPTLTTSRHVAATLLPSQLHPHNPQPVSVAVSPYLSLEFHPVPDRQVYQLQFMSVELLCIDPIKQALLPVASYFWENKDSADAVKLQTLESLLTWAKETHLRLCPNSPMAILRSREIRRLPDGQPNRPQDNVPPLVTTYDYAIVTDIQSAQTLAKRVFRLRSKISQLQFREGQCSSHRLPPANLDTFELSLPQTIGVQPLHFTNDNTHSNASPWTWGLSALRVSLQYSEGQQGIVGQVQAQPDLHPPSEVTLWWQAPQQAVQYRKSPEVDVPAISDSKEPPAAGLPAQFRARAILSFLPTSLTPPMPTLDLARLLNWQGNGVERWQPVLPGQIRYLLIGNRPGVMHAIRNQLLRQSQAVSRRDAIANAADIVEVGTSIDTKVGKTANTVLVSGSLPVQHRMPRPVPLPPNTNRQKALQPWASYFEPERNLMVSDAPADEAFYGEVIVQTGVAKEERKPAQRLQMRLIEPERGAIFPQWNGTLKFSITAAIDAPNALNLPSTPEQWEIMLTLSVGDQIISYTLPEASAAQIYEVRPQPGSSLQDLLASRIPGDLFRVQANVMPKSHTDNFKQTLTFPLRLLDETALPLPLKPQFIYFEDPEYNRRLASPAAHASQAVQVPAGSANVAKLVEVKLSADRREYNPDGVLSLRYDWAELIPDGFTAQLLFRRIDPDGKAIDLKIADSALATQAQALPQARLFQISLLLLQIKPEGEDWKPALRPDDVLEVSLTVRHNQERKATVNLPLNVVAAPVNPAPEAAYALLRRSESRVECVRFAWGPIPSQVELVNADDLRTEVVRRRAVFRWTDSVRPNTAVSHAIQKITQTGSTHFPDF